MGKTSIWRRLTSRRKKRGDDGHALFMATTGSTPVKPLPVIGGLPIKTQYWIATVLLLASFIAAAGLTAVSNYKRDYFTAHAASVAELKRGLKDLRAHGRRVADGLDGFAPQVYSEGESISTLFNSMADVTGQAKLDFIGAKEVWTSLASQRAIMAQSHQALLSARKVFEDSAAGSAELRSALSTLGGSDEAPVDQRSAALSAAPWASALSTRLEAGRAILPVGPRARPFMEELAAVSLLGKVIKPSAGLPKDLAVAMAAATDFLTKSMPELYREGRILESMRAIEPAAAELSRGSEQALALVEKADASMRTDVLFYERVGALAGVFAATALLAMALLAMINDVEGRKHTFAAKRETEDNQRAIILLLEEIGSLADGDLTVRASVTEEITEAIADSVNFAISEMGGLVAAIKKASAHITVAADRALSDAMQLGDINAKQSKDIVQTGQSVLSITLAIEQVARRMEDSQQVAQSSVESSARGMAAVATSIEGIRSIQGTVEETGRRIARLTEQSMQISEIVDLIGDIAERTSVLAINATVQATKAGPAGKGFQVVAEGVQDLANQAAEASRRIGSLIGAIQTEIHGAGVAMETTTAEARRGAALAETTGEALADINDVSLALSEIVVEVNEQIRQSARSASTVSSTMKSVLDSVAESDAATRSTGEAVEIISELTEQLGESVSGFRI